MSYLLDTDICSAFIKGDPRVWSKVMQYAGRLHISTITVAELFAWVLRAKSPPARPQGLLDFLSDMTLLHVDMDVARRFGEIRAA
ncbi:MAG: type II toxin-antitoxin system VapC family toxin, partial [Candidatus Hydrogenedentes bacterium]|nr:type II toxin-antitoxin system VapC family toxin [Candidatus Hydrogenedentota bacterium]